MAHDYKKQGKTNRRKGGDWEREVKADLESEGWIVEKFGNKVDLFTQGDEVIGGEFIKAKPYMIRGRGMMLGAGFPDFLCFKPSPQGQPHEIMFIECKINGTLSKEEKQRMAWLESEGYCCWVAGKDEFDCVELSKPKKTRGAT